MAQKSRTQINSGEYAGARSHTQLPSRLIARGGAPTIGIMYSPHRFSPPPEVIFDRTILSWKTACELKVAVPLASMGKQLSSKLQDGLIDTLCRSWSWPRD